MKLRCKFIFFILLMFFTSCAYYNTFHNTKKLYKEAKKAREKRKGEKPSSAELNKYDKTIEKASKILEIYPDSKYVDDAVFMLGECFYYKGDFVKAQRKFEELITYFPDSDYFYKAKLWLAKTNIKAQEYLNARYILLELIDANKIDRNIKDESQFLLSEVQLKQDYFEEAEKGFRIVAEDSKNKTIKANAYFQLGLLQINTQNYFDAVESFRNAYKYSPSKKFEFNAELNLASALKLSGDFSSAKKVCFGLLDNESFKDKHGLAKLEIADCIYKEGKVMYDKLQGANVSYLGKVEEALDEYKKITLEYKRTEFAARAYFQMAKIYEEDFGDYTSAKENYEKVKLEYNKAEFAREGTEKAKNIGDLIRLQDLVNKSEGMQFTDGTGKHARLTELELLLLEHGVHPELRFMKKKRQISESTLSSQPDDQLSQSGNIADKEPKKKDIDVLLDNKLQLAELYMFTFGKLDSAIAEYNEIIELFPENSRAAKALFSYAFIYENEYQNKFKTDSLLYELIERFPDSFQAAEARKILQLPPQINQTEQAANLYRSAENTLLTEKNINRAINEFQQIVENYPNSKFAPKALYAIGWVHECIKFDNDKAIKIFEDILKRYPDSEYSKTINKKLSEVEKAAAKQPAEDLQKVQQDTLNNLKKDIQPVNAEVAQSPLEATKVSKKDTMKKELKSEPGKKEKNKIKKQELDDFFK